MLDEVEENAKQKTRSEERGQEWARHWPYNTPAQLEEEKPWKNDELRKLEEALPPLR